MYYAEMLKKMRLFLKYATTYSDSVQLKLKNVRNIIFKKKIKARRGLFLTEIIQLIFDLFRLELSENLNINNARFPDLYDNDLIF
jgi:hypothetical protein